MVLELKDISYAWPGSTGGSPLLDGLSLELRAGERIALTGANGAGKTTLLHIIMGLIIPDSGGIAAFGRPMQSESDFVWMRRRVGFLFQDSDDQLFSPTVEEDVAFGPLNLGLSHAEARQRVVQTLQELGIEHLLKKVTHNLSGGEKRLVAFATIAAMHPEVYILDEPSIGLDRQRRSLLLEYIREYAGTCIITTHDEEFLSKLEARPVNL